jgi:hypothetical protein
VNTASRESNGSFHWRFFVEATFADTDLLAPGLAVLDLALVDLALVDLALVDLALGTFGLTDFLGPAFVVFSDPCALGAFDAAFLGVFLARVSLARVALAGAVFVDVLLDVERVRRVGVSLPGGLLINLLAKNSCNSDETEVYNAYALLNTTVLNST